MEFILNNKMYSIINQELFINYLMVDSYFKYYSKFDYDIQFDFIKSLLEKEKITMKDILEGTKDLEDLIEKGQISFIASGLTIDEHENGNFVVSYQDMKFTNVMVGEAIPLLIALYSLLNAKPVVSLNQIEEELNFFLDKFRSYNAE